MDINSKHCPFEIKDTIGKIMKTISRKSHLFLVKELACEGLEIVPNQIMFLTTLYNKGKLNQDEFTQLYYIDKGNSAKTLKKLEKDGYIYRIKDEKDKRVYIVYPTEKALEMKLIIFSILKKLDAHLSRNFTNDEYSILLSILKKI
ncbi:MAG: MarR family winged helix-turn-helix transcriptional regulator [Fusobacteriaceae bacterium]